MNLKSETFSQVNLRTVSVGDINLDLSFESRSNELFTGHGKLTNKFIGEIHRKAGGTAVQFAIGAKDAGFTTNSVVGVIGGDSLGEAIEYDLYNEGIRAILPRAQGRRTSVAVVIRGPSATDFSVTLTDPDQSLSDYMVDSAKEHIQKSDVFYCSGYCLVDNNRREHAAKMASIAKKAGALVVVDAVVDMSKSLSYDELKSTLWSSAKNQLNVDVLVSELPNIFDWLDFEMEGRTELDIWEVYGADIAKLLLADFSVCFLRTSSYSHEIVISADHISDPIALDYHSLPPLEKIGYGDRLTAQRVHNYISPRIVLASKSPQRLALLSQIVAPGKIEQIASNYSEEGLQFEHPYKRVERLALEKAKKVFNDQSYGDNIEYIISADTEIVLCEGGQHKMIQQPETHSQAYESLRALSGKEHIAATGLAVIGLDPDSDKAKVVFDVVKTTIKIAQLDDDFIDWYVKTDEPIGRAGGIAIQGLGALAVESIDGSYSNVVGMPLERLSEMLATDFKINIYRFDRVSCWRFADSIKRKSL